ncbi:MAG: hypothetical protein HOW73_45425 [Polyangiaceae bacterium]|nr:hypothetical protein [Polyangiaceae bacterium]
MTRATGRHLLAARAVPERVGIALGHRTGKTDLLRRWVAEAEGRGERVLTIDHARGNDRTSVVNGIMNAGLLRVMSTHLLAREALRRSAARFLEALSLDVARGAWLDQWADLYGIRRVRGRQRGPYLCRLHSDCLEHPLIAHGCWADTVEHRNDPARRYARHVDRLARRGR